MTTLDTVRRIVDHEVTDLAPAPFGRKEFELADYVALGADVLSSE